MEFSSEDALRLNVLLTHELQAVRIDENTFTLYALTEKGEARVALHPTGRKEQYLRLVREMLSGHALGSPGGYPQFIQRWTRMGQNSGDNIDKLLLLGEEEAVISVAYSPRLTDELARRAWWCMQSGDNARRMLERPCVAKGTMGPVLAEYLVEHLPFETSPHHIIDTVRIVLQPGLIGGQVLQRLWGRAKSDSSYYAGFIAALPDALPVQAAARSDWSGVKPALAPLLAAGNRYAMQLARVLDAPGQAFLFACDDVLRHPADQDVARSVFRTIDSYFGMLRQDSSRELKPEEVLDQADTRLSSPDTDLAELLAVVPALRPEIRSLLMLSEVGEFSVAPILVRTTAIGSLMRRKLEPVSEPVLEQIAALRSAS
ncbi:MAG: sulfur reduction protein DsrS [Pseudomonadota bacterium]|nr:sulfur reduction protein DsrS [Gammaproteobacteria bacterium]MBU1733219.1 sulfur reduction protein DsrS [Gammaproteobacteria bacterium]MBU1892267.1 sulfur reduction protein DsrS [Gammaproteobacteria bacterium]